MNKKKILAAVLSFILIAGSFSACGNSATPGKNNDGELKKAPEALSIISDEEKTTAAEVTAITAGVDANGKVVDDKGIVDVTGHKIYSTGVKDSNGMLIYTTGKKASNGRILYTKNQLNSFGQQIYYTGVYNDKGELKLSTTTEKPDYTTNNTPVNSAKVERTTTTTIGIKEKDSFNITDAKSNYIKFFGGSAMDIFSDIAPCKDGGYVCVGYSQSHDGDLNKADKDWAGHPFIVKYTASGEQKWSYTTGGDGEINITGITELKDESVVAVGSTIATDTDAPTHTKGSSSIIMRLDKNGKLIWMYSFPGDKNQDGDYASCVAATSDGGFVVGGKASSNTGFFTGDYGKIKSYIFKFDKNCNIKWRKILSGTKSSNFAAIDVAKNGDIYAICVTSADDGDFSGLIKGVTMSKNSLLVKLNKSGKLEWSKNLDGTGNSDFTAVCALDDGCVIGGNYNVYKRADGIFSITYGKTDAFIMRCNSKGEVNWARNFGGSSVDYITGIAQVEGGFAITGRTASVDYDLQGQKAGGEDDGFVAYLNSKGETCTVYRLDGSRDDSATGVCTLKDGSVAICGWTKSKNSFFGSSDTNNQYKGFVANFTAVSEARETTKKETTKK